MAAIAATASTTSIIADTNRFREDNIMTRYLRNTHPLVLTAAAAVTVFSVLGSAAVTGLIPAALTEKAEPSRLPYTSPAATQPAPDATSPSAKDGRTTACSICGIVESISLTRIDGDASGSGVIAGGFAGGVAIMPHSREQPPFTIIGKDGAIYGSAAKMQPPEPAMAYVVKVRMADGSSRTITQAEQPKCDVGEPVRVVSGAITAA